MCYLKLHRLIRIGKRYYSGNLPIQVIWKEIYYRTLPFITRNLIPWYLPDKDLADWLKANNAFVPGI